jgi:hypothetical protein
MTMWSARHTKEQILIPNIDANEETWALQPGYYVEVLENPHWMLERVKLSQGWLSCLET